MAVAPAAVTCSTSPNPAVPFPCSTIPSPPGHRPLPKTCWEKCYGSGGRDVSTTENLFKRTVSTYL
ncbi:hypothetical protein ACS0TY_033364 [Phlomoides rotata]